MLGLATRLNAQDICTQKRVLDVYKAGSGSQKQTLSSMTLIHAQCTPNASAPSPPPSHNLTNTSINQSSFLADLGRGGGGTIGVEVIDVGNGMPGGLCP
jgi:hypothetical protein